MWVILKLVQLGFNRFSSQSFIELTNPDEATVYSCALLSKGPASINGPRFWDLHKCAKYQPWAWCFFFWCKSAEAFKGFGCSYDAKTSSFGSTKGDHQEIHGTKKAIKWVSDSTTMWKSKVTAHCLHEDGDFSFHCKTIEAFEGQRCSYDAKAPSYGPRRQKPVTAFTKSGRAVTRKQFEVLWRRMLWRRHKVKAGLHCADEAQNKAETCVRSYLEPCKNPLFLTQLAAGFTSKGLLNLMTRSPVATGLAH